MSCHSRSAFSRCSPPNRGALQVKLPFNVVDLWSTTIAENDFSLEALLSRDEMRRALLFRSDRDAAKFVARRGIMRLILATYTGIRPGDIKFAYNQFGKPALDGRVHDVQFSVSQSGDLAIYAVARHRELGVDVEHFGQASLDIFGIAALVFREEEIAALNDIPAQRREEAFLRMWTRLEAHGKACGLGIGKLKSAVDSFHGRYFSFARPRPSPGYLVALAVQGRHPCRLRMTEFQIPMCNGSRHIMQART